MTAASVTPGVSRVPISRADTTLDPGWLPVVTPAKGGTGIDTSAAANGKILIGNGAGLTLANLTAGTNITITNGAGTITIAASGGGGGGGGPSAFPQFASSQYTAYYEYTDSGLFEDTGWSVTPANPLADVANDVLLELTSEMYLNIGGNQTIKFVKDVSGVLTDIGPEFQVGNGAFVRNRFAIQYRHTPGTVTPEIYRVYVTGSTGYRIGEFGATSLSVTEIDTVGGSSSAIESVIAGAGVTVDATDPANPIVAADVESVNTRTGAIVLGGTDIPAFVASGGSHAAGAVPDPGASAGSVKFLREDATWAIPAGGSTNFALGYSPVLVDLRQNSGGFAAAGGNNTVGKRFAPSERLTGANCVGARFYWGSASAGSVVCQLWDASGTQIAVAPAVTVGATSPGLYTATFGTPYTFVSGDEGKLFTVSMYDPSTVNQFNSTATSIQTAEPGVTFYATGRYGTGAAFPGTDGGANVYPVEPIFG